MNNDENEIGMIAMQIIMFAGDARDCISQAITAMGESRFEQAGKDITEAQEKIKQAHTRQTEVIQDEVRGITHPHSLLFSHAQDTLMTINGELDLAKQLLSVFKNLDVRLQNLEAREQ